MGKEGNVNFHTMGRHPSELKTEMKIFAKFLDYMGVCIIGDGNDESRKENLARLPYLRKWLRTPHATVMHLDNGTLQVNYIRSIKMFKLNFFCHYSTGRLPR